MSATVTRAASGDQDAWKDLVNSYNGALRSTARGFRLSEDEAADAAQTTWLLLLGNITKLRDPARVGGWLMCTMRRECSRRIRSHKREHLVDDWGHVPSADDRDRVDTAVLRAERDRLLWQAVDRLPEHQRQLLVALLSPTAPSYTQVARALSISTGAIGPTRARALRRLRDLLAAQGLTEAVLDPAA